MFFECTPTSVYPYPFPVFRLQQMISHTPPPRRHVTRRRGGLRRHRLSVEFSSDLPVLNGYYYYYHHNHHYINAVWYWTSSLYRWYSYKPHWLFYHGGRSRVCNFLPTTKHYNINNVYICTERAHDNNTFYCSSLGSRKFAEDYHTSNALDLTRVENFVLSFVH